MNKDLIFFNSKSLADLMSEVKNSLSVPSSKCNKSIRVTFSYSLKEIQSEAVLDHILSNLHDDYFLYVPTENESDNTVLAWGNFHLLVAESKQRFQEIKRRSTQFFKTVTQFANSQLPHPPSLKFYGGASFYDFPLNSDTSDNKWEMFKSARFFIPRWEIASTAYGLSISLCITKEELKNNTSSFIEAEKLESILKNIPSGNSYSAPATNTIYPSKNVGDEDKFKHLVKKSIKAIDDGVFNKVVVARQKDITGKVPFSISEIMSSLKKDNKDSVKFAVSINNQIFTGATPEHLLTVSDRGKIITSDALAGSYPKSDNLTINDLTQNSLLNSYKNRREFEYVLHSITANFEKMGCSVEDNMPLRVKQLKNIYHLHSIVKGVSQNPIHILDAVDLLHPTPAVCGTPKNESQNWLIENEDLERGWYGGPVGWFNAPGEGEFVVAIRSALIKNKVATLFAGCGIVKGSDPEDEFLETETKLKTMLNAIGELK